MDGGKPVIEFKVELIVEPDDIGFHAYCPALKGLHTCGETGEEALRNAKDAATAYLESLIKHGDPIPVGIIVHKKSRAKPLMPATRATHHTENLTIASAI